jgi:hypothetical protein
MKCVSIGRRLDKYKELTAFEYSFFTVAWVPVENKRMAYCLVGTNIDKGGVSPIFNAEIVNYTGKLKDEVFGITYVFKNGYLHNDNGAALFSDEDDKETYAKNGFFDDKRGEEWAISVMEQLGYGE